MIIHMDWGSTMEVKNLEELPSFEFGDKQDSSWLDHSSSASFAASAIAGKLTYQGTFPFAVLRGVHSFA